MREELKQEILKELNKGNHILLRGQHGVGKTYLVNELLQENDRASQIWLYFPQPKPPKAILLEILKMVLEDGEANEKWKSYKRGSIPQLAQYIANELNRREFSMVIILDDFHTITTTSATAFRLLIEGTKKVKLLCVANDEYVDKLYKKPEMKRLVWELKTIEMEPFTEEEAKKFIEEESSRLGLSLSKQMKERILKNCNRNALCIKSQLEALKKGEELRENEHGAIQDKPINLFPILVILAFSLVAFKYISRGTGDKELYSFGSFISMMLYFAFKSLVVYPVRND
ncbi:ATP-binding protein [Thermococcus barophilus]|uniref:AAA+ ATPase domain-containing protein n=1 Tax=Thermococcus barophilus (strain DSM 11836 / MP) TaxID=391623 RepID=F0LN84_THEBM|nr:ATP-binding protein [Thermococcus barophilus]ADT85223.1 hypothetical protein TERMP_02250 [Thermococcus barophilus MP]